MRVLGTAGSPGGLDLIRQNGVSEAFNHSESDYCDKIKVRCFSRLVVLQGTHDTGKTGKMTPKKTVRENTGNLEILTNTGKTRRIWFPEVVNTLILNLKSISIFAV